MGCYDAYNISGMLQFFKRGGLYSELDVKNIIPFKERMGTDLRAYNYPLLNKKEFKVSDALYLVSLHKNEGVRSAFLDATLH